MASENATRQAAQDPESASENTTAPAPRQRGRAAVGLSEPFTAVLEDYAAALKSAPLSDQTRRTYASKVRQFLAWLADAESDGDALNAKDARNWAVRDYRSHLQTALKRKPATVNNALAAVDDLYIRRGLGPANAARADLTTSAPKALSKRAAVRFLRAVDGCPSPRDPDPPPAARHPHGLAGRTPRLARRRQPRPVSQPARRPAVRQGRARHHHRHR